MVQELTPDQARRVYDDKAFDCDSTSDLEPLETIIGQERAVKALHFGLSIKVKGFNIFVSGPSGTGRKTAIHDFVSAKAAARPVPPDWVYVNNFVDSSKPRAIALPAGKGAEFKLAMEKFVIQIGPALRKAFESEDYSKQREATLARISRERDEIVFKINTMAGEAGFVVQPSQIGLGLAPLSGGKTMTEEEFTKLPPEQQRKIHQDREELNRKIGDAFRPLQEIVRTVDKEIADLNRQVAQYAVEPYIGGIREQFKENDEIIEYLGEVEKDIVDKLPMFIVPQPGGPGTPVLDPTKNYGVNLIVDNSRTTGAPVETELNPTYQRLFGYVEREAHLGALVTDYTMIRAGSAHRANGGFLVIPVERMFQDPIVWQALKQTLSTAQLEIEDPISRMGYMVTKSLRPEPIPFDAKVVLIGNPQAYSVLFSLDPDFKELFKVKADFDTVMDHTPENVKRYTMFVCTLVQRERLLHLDATALAAVIEHSSRLADDQEKLSTEFALIADTIREASFYAREEGSELVTRDHIRKQLEEKEYRSNMIQKKIEELIARGTFIIDVAGSKVGQVNGLAVLEIGDYAFGRPTRITASVGVGREGVIDLERLAQLGGATHTKGVLIISGFLNDRYALDAPLSLSARLVFEQSYSGVDGDSASSTELYALLSELAEVPIRQNIAVTGSVSQKGEVQAIGGVNQKIEGYFEVCKAIGLTGEQGCMIPQSNVRNLALKEEVVNAIRDGQFHVWPVRTIDEGIEVLTGVAAGERQEDGTYDRGTINDRVQQRLAAMAAAVKEYHI